MLLRMYKKNAYNAAYFVITFVEFFTKTNVILASDTKVIKILNTNDQ